MKKANIVTLVIFLLIVPATLFLGSRIPGQGYYLTSTLIIMELLIPFFLAFEGRKPQARELVLISVMCALAVAARVAVPFPNFKAIYGIIIIAGIAFGPESGFLVGAVASFCSNFFRGQSPFTPWQMIAYGAAGMIAGYLFRNGRLPRKPLIMGLVGMAEVLLFVGPLLDTCSFFLMHMPVNTTSILALYGTGFAVNMSQGISTFLVLFLLGKPLLEKLKRIQVKYGILRDG